MKKIYYVLLIFLLSLNYSNFAQTSCEDQSITLSTSNGDLLGRLLVPTNTKKCPIVLLISGSGPTDMDGNTIIANMKNNSLKFLAEGLVKNGIASLRYDKRGIGGSSAAEKNEIDLRFEDYVYDAIGWVNLLTKDKRFSSIIIAGHSEGSLIGMLACQKEPEIRAFISLAGAGRPAPELIENQMSTQPDIIKKKVTAINASLRSGNLVEDIPDYLRSLYRPSVQPYLISWFQYNPQSIISTLKIPIMIIQGKMDIQVKDEDAQLLKVHSAQAELLLINDMNHVLKQCNTLEIEQQMKVYTNPSLPIHSELLQNMVSFIKKIE